MAESLPSKQVVAGSSPVSRSIIFSPMAYICHLSKPQANGYIHQSLEKSAQGLPNAQDFILKMR